MRKFANFKPGLSQFANNIYVNAVVSVIVVLDIIIIFIISGSSRFDFIVIIKIDIVIVIDISIIITITITAQVLLSFLLPLLLLLKSFAENLVFVCHHLFIFSEFSLPSSNR